MKFGRLFQMQVTGATKKVYTIQSPLTIKFRVTNNSLFSCGTATFQIYNLTQDVRNDLFQDAYQIGNASYRQIQFAAGYQADSANPGAITLPIIYQGNVITAFSYRQGPDWITEISALDGGFAVDNGVVNLTKPSPWNFEDAMSDIVNQMPNVKLGVIGTFDLTNSRGITFGGSSWEAITQAVQAQNAQAFINKEQVYILQQWEYIDGTGLLDKLSEENGIIGSPRPQDGLVRVVLIFEPRLEVGQQINLEVQDPSLANSKNGSYKVLQLVHTGTISGAVCETLTTEVTMYQPDRALQEAS